mmetsp:Transcript_44391/g.107370  ORF Transcript_44391/g.107370 Transcript_44391/m.107370 type:complete len:579 (+) Transcript_44391:1507-3243(+)
MILQHHNTAAAATPATAMRILLLSPKKSTPLLVYFLMTITIVVNHHSSQQLSIHALNPSPSSTSRHTIRSRSRRRRGRQGNLFGSPLLLFSANSPTINEDDDDDHHQQQLQRKRGVQIGMTIALSSSYFAVMGAKCALPAVFSLLTSPEQGLKFTTATAASTTSVVASLRPPQQQMAQLLRISTIAVAAGKLLLGPLIDNFGGIRSLQLALTMLMMLLLLISTSVTYFTSFASCWIFVDFIFSACWAACINAIHQSFHQQQWSVQIGYLATGARLGNTVAFSLFGAVLYRFGDVIDQPWRVVFLVASILQVIPLTLLSYFGGRLLKEDTDHDYKDKKNSKKDKIFKSDKAATKKEESASSKSSMRQSLQILQREACTAPYWLHLISRSCLMVYGSFLLFVPTLMNKVYGYSLSFSNVVGSVYAFGCLLSISVGSQYYSSLSRKQGRVGLNAFLLLVATMASITQLLSVSGTMLIPTWASVLSLFWWGFSLSVPFYIPPSLFALDRGGKESSATIADSFDLPGFLFLAMFNGYVASIRHDLPSDWIGTFLITTGCSLVSLVSLSMALLWPDDKKRLQHK